MFAAALPLRRGALQVRDKLDAMLTELKEAHAKGKQGEYETRLEDWVGSVRDQVDLVPGRYTPRKYPAFECGHHVVVATESPNV